MRVALAGNPNVGKTTLFNALTGAHQEVANWPGTTVEYAQGIVPARDGGRAIEVVDLPGIYSLSACSPEERAARRFLLDQRPDAVVVVVDASHLERNLYLALEMIEFTPKLVVALNMVDEARKEGLRVDAARLSELLGVPVVSTIASRSVGVRTLLARIADVCADPPMPRQLVRYPKGLRERAEPLAQQMRSAGIERRVRADWAALQLLQGEADVARIVHGLPGSEKIVALARSSPAMRAGNAPAAGRAAPHRGHARPGVLAEDVSLLAADSRYEAVALLVAASTRRSVSWRRSATERIDAVALHPLWGYPIMALVFVLAFWIAFVASAPLSDAVEQGLTALAAWTAALLGAAGAPPFVESLLAQGIVPGVGAVLSFVPYMALFFAIYQLLQETGYMARASLLADRFMQLIGLHGKAFFGLVSAYGCNVPAMVALRVIENPRDRLLANLVVPFIPCNARLGVMAVMTAAFFPGASGAFAMIGLIGLSLVTVVAVSALYRGTALPGDPAPLVLELPNYHWPTLRNVLLPTGHRVRMFLGRIWWFLIWATIAIWALAHFPEGRPIAQSYAATIGRGLEIVGQHFGFDWRLMLAILFGFVAKETTLSTLGVLYGAGQGNLSLEQALAASMTPLVAFAYLAVYMLYVPCLSTVMQMRRESGGWTWTAVGVVVNVAAAFAVGFLVERVGVHLGYAM